MDIYFDHVPGSHPCFNTSAKTGQNQKLEKNSSCSCISIRNIGIYNYHIYLGWVGVGVVFFKDSKKSKYRFKYVT